MDPGELCVFSGEQPDDAGVRPPVVERAIDTPTRVEAGRLLEAYLNEAKLDPTPWRNRGRLKELVSRKAIVAASFEIQAVVCVAAIKQLAVECRYDVDWSGYDALRDLANGLLRRRLPLSDEDFMRILNILCGSGIREVAEFPIAAILSAVERNAQGKGLTPEIRSRLEGLRDELGRSAAMYAAGRKAIERIDRMLSDTPATCVLAGEAWSDAALADIAAVAAPQQAAWKAILEHAATATAAKPSRKWLKTARSHIDVIGADEFRTFCSRWFSCVGTDGGDYRYFRREHAVDPFQRIVEHNADVLKGLAWCAVVAEDEEVCRGLAEMGERCLKKIPNYGPRSQKVGNACMVALTALGEQGVVQLARLRRKVKYTSAQKLISKSLNLAAERAGITTAELEELAVPGFKLDEHGCRQFKLAGFTAELRIVNTTKTELTWRKSDGKRQKTVPSIVKRDQPGSLKELRATAKEIEQALAVQRLRVEQFLLFDPQWELSQWRRRYLEHPLVGILARRLIWRFERDAKIQTGIFHDGRLVGSNKRSLDPLDDASTVRLWHPMDAEIDEIRAWRGYLAEHRITQPFKQAHREIYVLTDAERETETYSCRFSSHLLKQHQLKALCHESGWRFGLQGPWDGGDVPTLELPDLDLQVQFFVEEGERLPGMVLSPAAVTGDPRASPVVALASADDLRESSREQAVSQRGVPLYVTSERICFRKLASPERKSIAPLVEPFNLQLWASLVAAAAPASEPHAAELAASLTAEGTDCVRLADIPVRVFSEVMRQVDLFVSLCSVSNDPRWLEHGSDNAREYWRECAFGDLSETARTRHSVLATLLPQLKIAGQCHLEDRYLVVDGTLHTYKIHLGSANVLMEPNGKYLCIVGSHTSGSGSRRRFLPFEGDSTLSLILSKAFLLAADASISDPTIRSQIDSRMT